MRANNKGRYTESKKERATERNAQRERERERDASSGKIHIQEHQGQVSLFNNDIHA